jgi:sugar (pentulose or hexulose) kinase
MAPNSKQTGNVKKQPPLAKNKPGAQPVIAIFDVGKTNKKLFLFDEQYKIVFEKTAKFTETTDEDGDACENLESLRLSLYDSLREVINNESFCIKAANISSYGASFVYIDQYGTALTPLYNYLKKYPPHLSKKFYDEYDGETNFAHQTASPVLGSLNSGMQFYRLKYEKPDVFNKVKYALHLPQYMSYLLTGVACSDITSIGCHTNLWDFKTNNYHHWVQQEAIAEKLAPVYASDKVFLSSFAAANFTCGIGLHDSSAALIPYLVNFHEPFILLSTGTWCISLNPFNNTPLTTAELENDCLSYLTFKGDPVKASRLFSGNEHEQQVKRIADHFNTHPSLYKTLAFDAAIIKKLASVTEQFNYHDLKSSIFEQRKLDEFATDIEAYHQLMLDIVRQQVISTTLILEENKIKRIFVDGGFSRNSIFMNLLAAHFPAMEIYAASMAEATALGAALAIHNSWNKKPIPNDIIQLKYFATNKEITV